MYKRQTWQLVLGGVTIAKAPCAVAVVGNCAPTDGQTAGGARTAPSPNGSTLRLTYDLDYEDERRAAWMRIFDQRNAADKVDVGLLATDGTPVRFAPPPAGTLPAVSEVVVRKYPSHWWIPPMIVGFLLLWLYLLRDTNTPVSYTHLDVYKRQHWWFYCLFETSTLSRWLAHPNRYIDDPLNPEAFVECHNV